MSNKLRWGVISTGRIAGWFTEGVARSSNNEIVAVASREESKAVAFATKHRIAQAHGSYPALLANPAVEAVYIGTPHPQHLEWILKAAAAGKHVLCEKPMTMSLEDTRKAIHACSKAGVVLMEAFMYRCNTQTERIVEIVRSGVLGQVGMVQSSFSFLSANGPEHRHWSKGLGGGGILDVGCYPVSLSRLIAGAAQGKPYLDPVHVSGTGCLHPVTGVDAYTAAVLGFEGGMIAQVSCGLGLQQENSARIYGDKGWLQVPAPFVLPFEGGVSQIFHYKAGSTAPERIDVSCPPLYTAEADAFAAAVFAGAKEVSAMTPGDSLGNMAVLEKWLAAAGVDYAKIGV